MIKAGLLALVLAGPAVAEGLAGQALCAAVWAKVGEGLSGFGRVSAASVGQDGDWCVAEAPVLDLEGQYPPDWHMDKLRFRGSALGGIVDGLTLPEGLEVAVEGLRLVIETGNPQMDWLFAAQSHPNRIDAAAALSWESAERVLRLEGLSIDFPGENLVDLSARVIGVDLSSDGAMPMAAASFALTEADVRITTHGLFEWYLLMMLGPLVLPQEGDMDVAADAIRADLLALVGELPDTSFEADSKAAIVALIGELPNPSGELTVALRSEAGIGPTRLGGYAVTGVPATVAEAAPLMGGVTVDIGWTHGDAP
ncbi:MAG: hypothetical protein FD150_1957 [Rhodobacteraceae bacterium]|nr:MAG: hypothetical protein FD150_1957 [Paracoccaceae bacterium]